MRYAPILLAVACLFSEIVGAQNTEGLITGRIRDRGSGRPLAGAKIRISSDLGARETVTDGRGYYSAPQVSPGQYQVSASKDQYQSREVHNLTLPVAGYLTVNLELRPIKDVWELGQYHTLIQGDESVLPFFGPDLDPAYTSHAEPIRAATGQFEPSVSEVIDPHLIDQLPLAGRDVYSALVFLPSVTSDAATVRSDGLSVNGQRPTSSLFLLDGLVNANHITTASLAFPPEAVQEYRVSTNNFSAEYGGTSGYIANAVTRRGGARWHGLLYANTEHKVLNANSFAHNANNIPRQPFRELQDGFWAGGPLPWKGFFAAASLEYFNSSALADPEYMFLPTEEFVNSLRAGSSAAALFRLAPPVRFGPSNGAEISLQKPVDLTRWTGLLRVDYEPSGNRHILFRATPVSLDRPAFSWTPYGQGGLLQSSTGASLSVLNSWGPSLVGDLHFGFETDRLGWDRANADVPSVSITGSSLTLPGTSDLGLHDKSHSSFARGGVVIAKGKHIWKAGTALLERALSDSFDYQTLYTFSNTTDFRNDKVLRLQLPQSRTAIIAGSVGPPAPRSQYRYEQVSAYFQEDYRYTPNLTLNAGLRYEWFGPPHSLFDTQDAAVVFAPGDPRLSVSNAMIQKTSGQLFQMRSNTWSVRLGGSYAFPLLQKNLTIRGGYGMFRDPLYDNLWLGAVANDIHLVSFGSPSCQISGNYLSGAPTLAPGCLVGSPKDVFRITAFANPLQTPLVHSFFLGTQARLSSAWDVELNGIGSLSQRLNSTDVLNRNFSPPPNPDLPEIYFRANEASSTYAAMTISVRYQSAWGGLRTFYTWSHSIDNQSDPLLGDFFDLGFSNQTDRFGTNQAHFGAFTLPNRPDADRGNSDFDQRHNFVVLSYWNPPGLTDGKTAALTRNWRFAEAIVVRSGLPYSVYAGIQNCQPICNTRANLVAPALLNTPPKDVPGGKLLLNAAAFGVPPTGVNGNTGRNAFEGPGFWNLDMSLSRTFFVPRLPESTRLELRADAFNILNHANLQAPANYLGDTNSIQAGFGTALFGRTGNAGFPALTAFVENARQVQLLIRLQF
jgi:hypothetical protein